MSKFGLLTYCTANAGDDIQSIAARQYLPKIDYYIDRDFIGAFSTNHIEPVHLLMNGWFLHHPKSFGLRNPQIQTFGYRLRSRFLGQEYFWPPSKSIDPFFISFHIQAEHLPPCMIDKRALRYYRDHSPIGCRDHQTVELLKSHGVDAYFSGCLTLTLNRPPVDKTEEICFVDPFGPDSTVPTMAPGSNGKYRELWELVPKMVLARANIITHEIDTHSRPEERLDHAQGLLEQYARAKLVVTGRLHCALPCLAFGTPVLFIHRAEYESRVGAYLPFLNHQTIEMVSRQGFELDWDSPTPNKDKHLALLPSLRSSCEAFVTSRF